MDNNKTYSAKEVNDFLDKVIVNVNKMIKSSKEKDEIIKELSEQNLELQKIIKLNETEKKELEGKVVYYSDKAKYATSERELILQEARKNADRIVNDALLRAERTEIEAMNLRRNIRIFKRRLKDIVYHQLEVIEDIEQVEL